MVRNNSFSNNLSNAKCYSVIHYLIIKLIKRIKETDY